MDRSTPLKGGRSCIFRGRSWFRAWICDPNLEEHFDFGFSRSLPPLFLLPSPVPPFLLFLDPIQVSTCPFSIYSAWVGGSILCSLSTFKDMWVTSKDYQDVGSSAVSRRSF